MFQKKMGLQVWLEGTLVAAVGMVLTLIPVGNMYFDLSLGLVPLVLYSLRRGLLPGMMAGFLWGLLSIISGGAARLFLSVPQIIFEYPFAFAFGGVGGLFAGKVQRAIHSGQPERRIYLYFCWSGTIAAIARFFWHYWAGVFVWGSYAPDNMSPYFYSLLVNGGSGLANAIYVSVMLILLYRIAPALFVPKVKKTWQ